VDSPAIDRRGEAIESRRRGSVWPFALRGGLGLALLASFLWFYGTTRILVVLARERPDFFAASVALYVAGQVMCSYRWQLLARLNGLSGRWREYLTYYFIGMFTNLFVPGLIGGDAARSTYLGMRHRRMSPAIASVVADRGIGLVALFWLAAVAASTVASVRLPPSLVRGAVALGLILLLGYLAAPIFAVQARRLGGHLGRIVEPLIPYLERPAALLPAILLSLVLQASLAVCQYLLALGMGLQIPLSGVLLVVPMANVVASIPLTLNGLGMREGAYLVLFGMAGVAHQDAIALGLLWFSSTMVGGLTGLLPFVLTPAPKLETHSEMRGDIEA
jgi:glycosyltransferase 2 family protein